METTKLSSKGQVVLPKSVRDAHKWQPGTEFAVEELTGGVLLRPLKPFKPAKFEEVFGCLKYSGKSKTPKQLDQAIAKAVKEGRDRCRY